MYLLNKGNPNKVDSDKIACYDVKLDNSDFNIAKLKELLAYCNPDLKKEVVFKNKFNYDIFSAEGPIYYPISTLLLVSFSEDSWKNRVDSQIVKYIESLLTVYNPTDLFPIYNIIKNDQTLRECSNENMLVDYLNSNYRDILNFREIFKHLELDLLYSYNIGNYAVYTSAIKNIKLFKPDLLSQHYIFETGNRNSETLKLLQLTPNIKQ